MFFVTPLNAVSMGLTLLEEELRGVRERLHAPQCGFGEPERQKELDKDIADLESWLSQLEVVHGSTANATDVLNDLLNWDKIAMGTLSLELTVFSLWELISLTANEFKLTAKKKQITFEVDNSLILSGPKSKFPLELRHSFAVGDSIRITQVLHSLYNNALKFTPEDGRSHASIAHLWLPTGTLAHGVALVLLPHNDRQAK